MAIPTATTFETIIVVQRRNNPSTADYFSYAASNVKVLCPRTLCHNHEDDRFSNRRNRSIRLSQTGDKWTSDRCRHCVPSNTKGVHHRQPNLVADFYGHSRRNCCRDKPPAYRSVAWTSPSISFGIQQKANTIQPLMETSSLNPCVNLA